MRTSQPIIELDSIGKAFGRERRFRCRTLYSHVRHFLSDENEGVSNKLVHRSYPDLFLKNVSFSIRPGEVVAIIGRSGSGKTTLLNILAALTPHTTGKYLFCGNLVDNQAVNDRQSTWLRRHTGYINQSSDLLPNFTVFENIRIACRCRGEKTDNDRIRDCLAAVKLDNMGNKMPATLSGGERQRANIARAVACVPPVIFADEPTGALDVYNGQIILDLLREQAQHHKVALVLVTHNPEAAAACQRVIGLHKGRVVVDKNTGLNSSCIRDFIITGKSP